VYKTLQGSALIENKINFQGLWFHDKNIYSISIKQDNKLAFKRIRYKGGGLKIEVIMDVPIGEQKWFEERYWWNEWYGYKNLKNSFKRIHITSESDIQRAGWNYGKFGNGTTKCIQ
jgi:hypothetical protein